MKGLLTYMKEIINAYEGYRLTNDINDVLKKEMDMTIVEVMVLNEIAQANDTISKTDLEKRLGLSKSVSQKITKQLRKNRMIIKDRDIDNESHVILSMNDDMKQKAKQLFERVERAYEKYKNPPQENQSNDNDVNHAQSQNNENHHENHQNKFENKKHHKK